MQRQILSKLFVKIVQKLDAIFDYFFGWSFLNLMLKPVSIFTYLPLGMLRIVTIFVAANISTR